jgi:hypothetical protein
MEAFPTDHLPALVRKTTWEWRNDFFDSEIPLSIELHFRFWNPDLERLAAPGTEEFWKRRVKQPVNGVELGVLCPPDALAYAALHLVKHLLRGSGVRPFHVLRDRRASTGFTPMARKRPFLAHGATCTLRSCGACGQ